MSLWDKFDDALIMEEPSLTDMVRFLGPIVNKQLLIKDGFNNLLGKATVLPDGKVNVQVLDETIPGYFRTGNSFDSLDTIYSHLAFRGQEDIVIEEESVEQ